MTKTLNDPHLKIQQVNRLSRNLLKLVDGYCQTPIPEDQKVSLTVKLGAVLALATRGLFAPLLPITFCLVETIASGSPTKDESNFAYHLLSWIEDNTLKNLCDRPGFLKNLEEILDDKSLEDCLKDPLLVGWLYQICHHEAQSYSLKRSNKALQDLASITKWYTPLEIGQFLAADVIKEKEENENLSSTYIDPACGAGHILLPLMNELIEQGLSVKRKKENRSKHPDKTKDLVLQQILSDRLYGLDIDEQAVKIAGFSIYLLARDLGSLTELPLPKLYYFVDHKNEQINLDDSRFGSYLLGLEDKGTREQHHLRSLDDKTLPLSAIPTSYDGIVANPPYLSNRLMPNDLKTFLQKHYPESHYDLYTSFIELSIRLLKENGTASFICQNSFLTISRYERFRESLLVRCSFKTLVHLGTGTFASRSGEKVNSSIVSLVKNKHEDKGESTNKSIAISNQGKVNDLKKESFSILKHRDLEFVARALPGQPISPFCPIEIALKFQELPSLQNPQSGIHLVNGLFTCNNKKFVSHYSQIDSSQLKDFVPYDKGGGQKWYATTPYLLKWKNGGADEIRKYRKVKGQSVRLPGENDYFRPGITYSYIGTNGFRARLLSPGAVFDIASSSLFSTRVDLFYLLGFLNSALVKYLLGILNPTINFQIGDLRKLPYIEPDKMIEEEVASLAKEAVSLAKELEGFDRHSPGFDRNNILEPKSQNSSRNKTDQDLSFVLIDIRRLKETERNIQAQINQHIFKLYDVSTQLQETIESNCWVQEHGFKDIEKDLKNAHRDALLSEDKIDQAVRNFLISPCSP